MFWCLVPKPKPGPKPASFVMDGWMLPFFFCPQTSKDLLGWGFHENSFGEFERVWLGRQRRAGERIDRDRSEPPRRRERNETTATERRAGSMVRIRWAPGDRGEAPASSRFRRETETERERERERRRGSEATLRRRGPRVPSRSRREENFNHLLPC